MRTINKIIIHYAWTPADMDIGADEIREWHLARDFQGIGYHFVIRRNGKVERGRPLDQQGAHARGHNEDSIGICLIGGKPEFNFTRQQLSVLEMLVFSMTKAFSIEEVGGHRDYAASKCPGFDVREWWNS